MAQMCHSCAAPLDNPEFKGAAADYCKYCVDEKGKLKSKEEIQRGIAEWFKMWQPNVTDQIAMNRAAMYLKAMPAWVQA